LVVLEPGEASPVKKCGIAGALKAFLRLLEGDLAELLARPRKRWQGRSVPLGPRRRTTGE
jgi:hypothetical protein